MDPEDAESERNEGVTNAMYFENEEDDINEAYHTNKEIGTLHIARNDGYIEGSHASLPNTVEDDEDVLYRSNQNLQSARIDSQHEDLIQVMEVTPVSTLAHTESQPNLAFENLQNESHNERTNETTDVVNSQEMFKQSDVLQTESSDKTINEIQEVTMTVQQTPTRLDMHSEDYLATRKTESASVSPTENSQLVKLGESSEKLDRSQSADIYKKRKRMKGIEALKRPKTAPASEQQQQHLLSLNSSIRSSSIDSVKERSQTLEELEVAMQQYKAEISNRQINDDGKLVADVTAQTLIEEKGDLEILEQNAKQQKDSSVTSRPSTRQTPAGSRISMSSSGSRGRRLPPLSTSNDDGAPGEKPLPSIAGSQKSEGNHTSSRTSHRRSNASRASTKRTASRQSSARRDSEGTVKSNTDSVLMNEILASHVSPVQDEQVEENLVDRKSEYKRKTTVERNYEEIFGTSVSGMSSAGSFGSLEEETMAFQVDDPVTISQMSNRDDNKSASNGRGSEPPQVKESAITADKHSTEGSPIKIQAQETAREEWGDRQKVVTRDTSRASGDARLMTASSRQSSASVSKAMFVTEDGRIVADSKNGSEAGDDLLQDDFEFADDEIPPPQVTASSVRGPSAAKNRSPTPVNSEPIKEALSADTAVPPAATPVDNKALKSALAAFKRKESEYSFGSDSDDDEKQVQITRLKEEADQMNFENFGQLEDEFPEEFEDDFPAPSSPVMKPTPSPKKQNSMGQLKAVPFDEHSVSGSSMRDSQSNLSDMTESTSRDSRSASPSKKVKKKKPRRVLNAEEEEQDSFGEGFDFT